MLLLIVAFLSALSSSDSTKIWIRDTNFDNPENWDSRRLPCSSDRIIFSSSINLPILLPEKEIVAKEIIFPYSGEILLFPNTKLIVTHEANDANCPGKDITFIRTEKLYWSDPSNWKIDGVNDQAWKAVPHGARVPCLQEQVIFPQIKSYQVILPEFPVTVGQIEIHGQNLSVWQLDEFLLSDVGEHEFSLNPSGIPQSIQASGVICEEKTGCVCRIEYEGLLKELCSFVQKECYYGYPPCFSGIQPHGHCCKICGSLLEFAYDPEIFEFSALKKFVNNKIGYESGFGIEYNIQKKLELVFQVIIIDQGDFSQKSKKAAEYLMDALLNDEILGVTQVSLKSSGMPITSTRLGLAITEIGISFTIAILAFAIIFVVFMVLRGSNASIGIISQRAFGFARFENIRAEEDEEEGGRGESESQGLVQVDLGEEPLTEEFSNIEDNQQFDNPMFGKKEQSLEVEQISESLNGSQLELENPMFEEVLNVEVKDAKNKIINEEQESVIAIQDSNNSMENS